MRFFIFIIALSLAGFLAHGEGLGSTEKKAAIEGSSTPNTGAGISNSQVGNIVPVAGAAVAESAVALTDDSKIKTDNRKESEIALNLDANKKAATGDNTIFRILFSLSILAVLGTGAYFFLRKYAVPKGMKTQTQIKILQQHYLGPKKSLAIVRVAGESILIGVTEQNITMLKSLSLIDDEVPEESPTHFANVLGKKIEGTFKLSGELSDKEETENKEDFSFGGIRDVVSKRLKGMRNLE